MAAPSLSLYWCMFALASFLTGGQGDTLFTYNARSNGTTNYRNNEFTQSPSSFGLMAKGTSEKRYTTTAPAKIISLPLSKILGDPYFTTPITIGDQAFHVVVDTGSHDFWVNDVALLRKKGVKSRRDEMKGVFEWSFYDKERSLSYKPSCYDSDDQRKRFRKKYASHLDVRGSRALETMKMGGAVIKEVPFATVTALGKKSPVLYAFFDGIMGLGAYDAGATDISLFEKMVGDKIVERQIISFHITSAQSGRLILGGIDHDLFSGRLQYMRVMPQEISSKWMVKISRFTYGGSGIADNLVAGALLHIDSGSPRFKIPSKMYDILLMILGIETTEEEPLPTVRCDKLSGVANLEIEILGPTIAAGDDEEEGLSSSKEKKSSAGRAIATTTTKLSFSPHEYFERHPEKEGQCVLLLRPGPPHVWRIGLNPFFRKYYVAFDYKEKLVGFAPSISSAGAKNE